MIDYYAQRAAEYEQIYQRPERQVDLRILEGRLGQAFPGEQVLEIACGTGYWTQFIAKEAKAIRATDFNAEVIQLAEQKSYASCDVTFQQADAYTLANVEGSYTAGFAGFWWSHLPITRIADFLHVFHARLQSGARVILVDNLYVEGSSTPLSHTDQDGNTYQMRQLQDGSRHEVLKNFPSEVDLRQHLAPFASQITYTALMYYWVVQYIVPKD